MSETITEVKITDLMTSISEGWKSFLENEDRRRGQRSKARNVYASAWRACTRRMTLEMVAGDQLPAWKPEQLANFRRGSDRERDIVSDLKIIGRNAPIPYEVGHEQERFEVKDKKGRTIITGKKDGDFMFSNGIVAPFEVKSWNPNTVARISTFADLMDSPWTKSASYQLLTYLHGFRKPVGFFVLDRNGLPLPIPDELEPNMEQLEGFLAQSEQAMDAKEAYDSAQTPEAAEQALPPFIQDHEECHRCPFFGSICQPPISHDAATILADGELEAVLKRREEIKDIAHEYDGLDKLAKTQLRNIEMGICGTFLIEGKAGHRKEYTVKACDTWQVKITKI